MDPHLKIDNLPGCRGDCNQGRQACPCPEECAPDGPPFTRTGCFWVLTTAVLAWCGVAAAYLLAVTAARLWWGQ
jgi:hypothetical protein